MAEKLVSIDQSTLKDQTTPGQKVAKALDKLSKPWTTTGQAVPSFQVIEVSREAQLGVTEVITALTQKEGFVGEVASVPTTIYIADRDGTTVNGNMKDEAYRLAPMKRVIRAARFQAREPGNSKQGDIISTAKRRKKPVIKSKQVKSQVAGKKLELGKERLPVSMKPYTIYDVQTRREEVKARKAQRDMKRFGIVLESPSQQSQEDVEQQTAQLDFLSAIQYINALQTSRPVQENKIKERFLNARQGKTLQLFVPWGVRPTGEPTLETEILNTYQKIKSVLRNKGLDVQIFIMPADVYATEVNNQVDPTSSENYFAYITQEAQLRDFMVKSWSAIREENKEWYERLASQLDEDAIDTIVANDTILKKAFASAKRRSGNFSNRSIELSMYAYLRERICEGIIVEQVYEPVKMGLAPKLKDEYIDGQLPRLYVFPPNRQLPWLKN